MSSVFVILMTLVVCTWASGEKLSMTIHQSGFHRTLRYDTYFLQPWWQPGSCEFCLEQTIPSGAYVDTDQLDDLMRMNKIHYYTASKVNVEAIASKSSAFKLYVYGDASTTNTIKLPVHFRYHLAGEQSFIRVTLEPPRMFMNCTQDMQLLTGQHLSEIQDPSSGEPVQLPCKPDGTAGVRHCRWQRVNYDLHSDPIAVSLPIGSRAVEPLVTFVSITVAWAACYYISLAVYNKAKELDRRI